MSTNGDREQKQSGRNQRRHMRACAQPSRRGKGVRMVAVLVGLFIILVLPIIVIDVLEIWKEPFVPLAVVYAGAPNENIVQNHLNIALLNVF